MTINIKSRNARTVSKEIEKIQEKLETIGFSPLEDFSDELLSLLANGSLSSNLPDTNPNFVKVCLVNITKYLYSKNQSILAVYDGNYAVDVLKTIEIIRAKMGMYIAKNKGTIFSSLSNSKYDVKLFTDANTILNLIDLGENGQSYFKEMLRYRTLMVDITKDYIIYKASFNTELLKNYILEVLTKLIILQENQAKNHLYYRFHSLKSDFSAKYLKTNNTFTSLDYVFIAPKSVKIIPPKKEVASTVKTIKLSDSEQEALNSRMDRYKTLAGNFMTQHKDLYNKLSNVKFNEKGIIITPNTGQALINFNGILNTKTGIYSDSVSSTRSYLTIMEDFKSKNVFNLNQNELNLVTQMMITAFDRKRSIPTT